MLRSKLTTAYPTSVDARRVTKDAGIPHERIDFGGTAEIFWQSVLDEAERHQQIDALVRIATEEYPELMGSRDGLEALLRRRDELRSMGADTRELDAEILAAKRAVREGPQLRADEYLGDGRFRLLKELGHGGFATVWLAYDRTGQRHVAVKVLHGQYVQDRGRIERFDRGARALFRLDHHYIVRIVQLREVEQGFHYFVMEYVSGGTLRDAVLEKRLDTTTALGVVASVGDALANAHEADVVHRDVKPANVLLREDGSAVLTDFDLALLGDSTGGTRTGAMGTFWYMAPEVAQDARVADHRSDVFSLGMTALFVVLGRDPTRKEWADHNAALTNAACSDALKSVIARALAEEPTERFQAAAAFVTALRDAVAQRDAPTEHAALPAPATPSVEPPPSPTTPQASLPQVATQERVPLPPPAGFTVPVQVVLPPPVAMQPVVSPPATTDPVRPSSGSARIATVGALALGLLGVVAWVVTHQNTATTTPDAAVPSSDAAVVTVAAQRREECCPEDMVLIRGGTFQMGSPDGERDSEPDEHPQHAVTLPSFCVDRTEASVASWQACVAGGGCDAAPTTVNWPGVAGADHQAWDRFCNGRHLDRVTEPINCIDWLQARRYCAWSGHPGGTRRLLREAEWEFAARGTRSRGYPWGNEAPDGTRANLCGEECEAYARSSGVSSWGKIAHWRDAYGALRRWSRFVKVRRRRVCSTSRETCGSGWRTCTRRMRTHITTAQGFSRAELLMRRQNTV